MCVFFGWTSVLASEKHRWKSPAHCSTTDSLATWSLAKLIETTIHLNDFLLESDQWRDQGMLKSQAEN